MTTKFLTCGQEASHSLAALIDTANNDSNKTAFGLITKGDVTKLVGHFLKSATAIFAMSEEDIDAAFSLAFAVLREVDKSQTVVTVQNIADMLASDTPASPKLRLNLLATFFNTLEDESLLRHPIFVNILKLALASGKSSVVAPYLTNVDAWAGMWKLDGQVLRDLYLLVSKVALASEKKTVFQQSAYKYLSKVTAEAAAAESKDNGAADVAESAIALAIGTFEASHYTSLDALLEFPLVAKLEEDSARKPAVQIAKILCFGTVSELKNLLANDAATKAFLAKHKLSSDTVSQRMNGMVLAGVGESSRVASYDAVAVALETKDDLEVEEAVTDAITLGLIDAKMDSRSRTVRFDSVRPRAFTAQSWATLASKVAKWSEAVSTVIKASKERASAEQNPALATM